MRRRLTYGNLMATAAMFVALSGGAYAVSKNSVDSKAIKTEAVRSQELENDDVRSADIESDAVRASDVEDGSLAGGEIADGSLGGADVGDGSLGGADVADGGITGVDVGDDSLGPEDVQERDFELGALAGAGILGSQARQIGGDGDETFGPISGRALAGTMEEVETPLPPPTLIGNLIVWLPDHLAAGETRRFTVVLQGDGVGGPTLDTTISCTVHAGEDHCFDLDRDGTGALLSLAAVRIESDGATLSATDTAYIALAAESPLEP